LAIFSSVGWKVRHVLELHWGMRKEIRSNNGEHKLYGAIYYFRKKENIHDNTMINTGESHFFEKYFNLHRRHNVIWIIKLCSENMWLETRESRNARPNKNIKIYDIWVQYDTCMPESVYPPHNNTRCIKKNVTIIYV